MISLPADQWALVNELELNMFIDDGEGFIDLGLDNVFDFDEAGNLLAPQDCAWVVIGTQTVPYYHEYTSGRGETRVDTGYVPVLLNGERAELLISFDADGYGAVTGARYVYTDGQTDNVAKSQTALGAAVDFDAPPAAEEGVIGQLKDGDTIDFICDYYHYDGSYENSYRLGRQMVVSGELEVGAGYIPAGVRALMCYRFTDLYGQHYWSLPLEG